MSFLSGFARGGDGPEYDTYDEFVPENVPEPGPFLADHDVLTGRDHAAFHRLTRDLFEERGVFDMTFGYNLARLNLDRRHPDAGFRYAIERGAGDGETGADDAPVADADERVLRAEFTPTTEFCPQSDTLTQGAFRAWNGLRERHEFDRVRVRVDGMHQESVVINGKLQQLEAAFREEGEVLTEVSGDHDAAIPDEAGYETPL